MDADVRVYVVTFRRPHLLERALRSLTAQTHAHWVAEVLNDDPADDRVAAVIRRIGDPRIQLSHPPQRRGGTGNFNHAFRPVTEPFASILEDDNWWEPEFLRGMQEALARHPTIAIACGNERLWRERIDGTWENTDRTIWSERSGSSLFACRALDKCGQAKLCNSALLFRTAGCGTWTTPAGIPIDVTEHFRERVVPHPFLLVHSPWVNYGETRTTHRSARSGIWGSYQVLLIGSTFAALPPALRPKLAARLWQRARGQEPHLASSLLATGSAVPQARALREQATRKERFRHALGAIRHPVGAVRIMRAPRRHAEEWQWLLHGPFPEYLAELHDLES